MNMISKIKLLTLLAVFPVALFAQKSNKQDGTVLPLDSLVRTGKLANGFTYFIRHNEEPDNRVVMYLVNKVGSVLEDEDQRGLAHFMEHMSFNGTTHFPKNELVDYLQKSGVRFGADLNAYTSFDETVYQLPIPSDNPKLLAGGLQIMRDWAQEATLDSVEINKERGVVLEEKRLGKGAKERMQRVYWPLLLNRSRYAERLPIGIDKVLNNFRPAEIRRFYKDWYRPDLQALIVVGDINVNSMEQKIRRKFATLKNPSHERPRPHYSVPLTGKNQFIVVTDKEMTQTMADIQILHKQPKLRTAADYRRAVVQNLFNQMLGERMRELVRSSDPPFVNGSAGISTFIGGLDAYNATVVARPGELEKGIKAVWRETERVKRFGFTATELQRAKDSYLSSMKALVKEKNKTNSVYYVREYQQYFLKDIAAPGIDAEFQMVKNDLPGIGLQEVNQLCSEYIHDVNRNILIQAPEKDKGSLPSQTIVYKWINEVAAEKLQPYEDGVSNQPLLLKDPVAGTLKSSQFDKEHNITTLTLSNGVKVVLKATDFKNNSILFTSFKPGGTSVFSDADYESAANAANIIPSGGAGNYSLGELDKYLQGKELFVHPYISERFEGVNGNAAPKDLETALQLIYAYYTEPRKDTAIFRGIIERSKAALMNRADDPGSVFSDSVSAILGNYNVRRMGPTVEKLGEISLDKAYSIYQKSFEDATGVTFTFVGSFDVKAITPLLEKYLGGLPSAGDTGVAMDLNIHIPAGKISRNIYKGTEPKATVLLVYSGKFDYTPENKTKLDALKETLEIRLLQRLREEESGVYSPGVFDQTMKYPDSRFRFIIQFGCAPKNVDKLVQSTLDEIKKLKADGPSSENIEKYKAENLQTHQTALKTNQYWLGYISEQLQNGEDMNVMDDYDTIMNRITSQSLKQAAGQYLNGDNYIRLVLLPVDN